jgi:hypothetical protein
MNDDHTIEALREALKAGWEGHPSDLVDEEWCWVTEARHFPTAAKNPTNTVHRVNHTQMNTNTYLRPIRPNDPIEHRCDNCAARA